MKILKLLNKRNLSILVLYIFSSILVIADEKPVDIWNLEKKEISIISETDLSTVNSDINPKGNIYNIQTNKKIDKIELDQELVSKDLNIIGIYDPEDYGLSIDMWSNSDGYKLKKLFKNINQYSLSKDAAELMNISMLTNSYSPNQNITEEEFLNLKSDWLIKDSNLELIEEYLIKNQSINLHPELTRYLVDIHLSNSNIKKSCEIFSNNSKPIQNEYLSKFNLYCLINYGKNEEAQLILDLKKELGFQDEYFENKINYLFGFIEEVDSSISEKSILDFHLAHRTNQKFSFEPTTNSPKFVWKYLSASNLLFNIKDIEVTDLNKISIIEKAVNDKNYPEKDLFEFYKKFQFNINQFLNAKDVFKSLSPIEGRALLYQRALLIQDPTLKLEFIKNLKDVFKKDGITNAFDLELKKFLNQIDEEDVPSNYTTFYNNFLKTSETEEKKIKFNNKILHQSKLVNYFNGDYAKSRIEQELEKFLKKIKKDKKYFLSKKDIIFLEALKSDGIKVSKKYDSLYEINKSEMPNDIQLMIDNNEIGAALLRIIEVIGPDKIEDIDDDTVYFIINTLNQLNVDLIRNKLLLKILTLKV
tara:strand:- start:1464 stop:3227 length:1764 start_codon:yes stop_codon:yes gene_type:complete